MGHLQSQHKAYRDLQARMDRTHIGMPEGARLYDILRMVYTEDEARVAARMPVKPISAEKLGRRIDMPVARLQPILDHMTEMGTVMDVIHPDTGAVRYLLSPPVVGWVEYSLMKPREEIDAPALAMAYDAYIADGAWFRSFGGDKTQIGRTMVNEDTLDPAVSTEVLDYEKASYVLRNAKALGVSQCYCRHKAEHLGHACDAPQEVCLNINAGHDYVTRHGYGRTIDVEEALDILALAREKGLVQIADNVKHRPIYLCNCCGCCCMQLRVINRHGVQGAIHTSNFMATVDADTCRGCGRCARRCPVSAIQLQPVPRDGKRVGKMRAVIDEDICLGCGICHTACRHGALTMVPRAQRVLTPETTLERVVRMAIDRGKLQHLIFDQGDGLPASVANRVLGTILALPPARKAMAVEQVKSRFVRGVVDRFKGGAKRAGRVRS